MVKSSIVVSIAVNHFLLKLEKAKWLRQVQRVQLKSFYFRTCLWELTLFCIVVIAVGLGRRCDGNVTWWKSNSSYNIWFWVRCVGCRRGNSTWRWFGFRSWIVTNRRLGGRDTIRKISLWGMCNSIKPIKGLITKNIKMYGCCMFKLYII